MASFKECSHRINHVLVSRNLLGNIIKDLAYMFLIRHDVIYKHKENFVDRKFS